MPSPPNTTPLGFGAFKIGRNMGIKYPSGYELPSDQEVDRLLNGVLDLGCNLIDTAPAYGTSEERIGRSIGHRRSEFFISTKVGETFENGASRFDYSGPAIRESLARSLKRLKTDFADFVFIHSSGDDLQILNESPIVEELQLAKQKGIARFIGMSGKTPLGTEQALAWSDAVMVEYNSTDQSHSEAMSKAAQSGKAVFVKKGLGSGRLNATESIQFVLSNPAVSTLVVGSLSLANFQNNWSVAVDLSTRQG